MSLIYVPKGKAREYSPMALNTYSGGCDHACRYCYCSDIGKAFGRGWTAIPVPRNLSSLQAEAVKTSRQIMLCFMGDPYCKAETMHRNTRLALSVLSMARCSVAILSKGGKRCLDDLDIFQSWPDHRIKVGATLTFRDPELSFSHEPGAALPQERLYALEQLHLHGIQTWASIEPVIDPAESLSIIRASLPFVDAYKVGKLNHDKRAKSIDWKRFGLSAVDMVRSENKELYVKADLRPYFPDGYLTQRECDMESLSLPDRPKEDLFA